MLVLAVLLLPVLLGMAALAIDLGQVYVERSSLQQAADAAALAAAQNLDADGCDAPCTEAIAVLAGSYSRSNLEQPATAALPACVANVDANCFRLLGPTGTPDRVEVVLASDVDALFAGILGKQGFSVRARAVAFGSRTGEKPALLFASSGACDAIGLNGRDSRFGGAVVTNGGVQAPSSGISGDVLVYGNEAGRACVKVDETLWGTISGGPTIAFPVPVPTCLPAGACLPGSTVQPTSVNGIGCRTLPIDETKPGVYCSTSAVNLTSFGAGLDGFAIVAPSISGISGTFVGSQLLYQRYGGLLFFAYGAGSNVVRSAGNGVAFRGAIFAPWGEVQVSGSSASSVCGGTAGACGFIEAQTINLAGANASWQGLGPGFGGATGSSLVE